MFNEYTVYFWTLKFICFYVCRFDKTFDFNQNFHYILFMYILCRICALDDIDDKFCVLNMHLLIIYLLTCDTLIISNFIIHVKLNGNY